MAKNDSGLAPLYNVSTKALNLTSNRKKKVKQKPTGLNLMPIIVCGIKKVITCLKSKETHKKCVNAKFDLKQHHVIF
ncbi:hypothetical protein SAMN05661044_01156 [Olivibacter domesticus]|uniref:Uncharacterized protein n=1 Tax=Olivibacter domesticus TaxID=407022 RepID=A0A1H7JX26_OLID1|nr:hypothetical protein SAMN05661044_01156 [Olivibacter domesticus]